MLRKALIKGLSKPISSTNTASVRPLFFKQSSSYMHLNRRMFSTTPFSKEEEQQMERVRVLEQEEVAQQGLLHSQTLELSRIQRLLGKSKDELRKIQEPRLRDERRKEAILAVCKMIYQAKIQNQDKITIVDHVLWQWQGSRILGFLKDCLNCSIETQISKGWHEETSYYHVALPKIVPNIDSHLLEEWEKLGYQKLQETYKQAEEDIEKDFCLLKGRLYTSFYDSEGPQAFVKNNVCPAALDRFKQFVNDNDKLIRITVSEDFIMAERESPEVTQTEERSSRPNRS